MIAASTSEWRCRTCNLLLAVELGEQLYLKLRRLQYLVRGGEFTVTTVCSKCLTANELSRGVRRGASPTAAAPVGTEADR